MSGRAKRVLVYTAALLFSLMPAMPFGRGSPGFAVTLGAAGALIALASAYVLRGEWGGGPRSLPGLKLLASSVITLLFGVTLAVGSLVYLLRG